MKSALFVTVLLLVGCTAGVRPIQHISDARAAVYAAEDDIQACRCTAPRVQTNQPDRCGCRTLREAKRDIERAETLFKQGDSAAANAQAQAALDKAQNLLRRHRHATPN